MDRHMGGVTTAMALIPALTFGIPRGKGSYCCAAAAAANDEMTRATGMRRWIHKQNRARPD